MDTNACLTNVAWFELNALICDARGAVSSLKRQRKSVVQAIETVRQANDHPSRLPNEADTLVVELLDRLDRLNTALERVISEIEQM